MKTKMNPLKNGFIEARNEPNPRFISNGIHLKGDAENLKGSGYKKDQSASQDQSQQGKKEKGFDTQSSPSLSNTLFFSRTKKLSLGLFLREWKDG